nr:unnamed protein product [Digitaria exilis]
MPSLPAAEGEAKPVVHCASLSCGSSRRRGEKRARRGAEEAGGCEISAAAAARQDGKRSSEQPSTQPHSPAHEAHYSVQTLAPAADYKRRPSLAQPLVPACLARRRRNREVNSACIR